MKSPQLDQNRSSFKIISSQHRKFLRRSSPDSPPTQIHTSHLTKPKNQSNQEILQLDNCIPELVNSSNSVNTRYEKAKSNQTNSNNSSFYFMGNPYFSRQDGQPKSKAKVGRDLQSRDSSGNQIIESKNFLADKRKKGRSTFHKKIVDMSNSQLFLLDSKVPTTKEVSKGSCQSEGEGTLQEIEGEIEELHYRMVKFMQKCKKIVAN